DSIIFKDGAFVDIIEIISGLTGKKTRYDPDIHVLYKDEGGFLEWLAYDLHFFFVQQRDLLGLGRVNRQGMGCALLSWM
ncbi:MAG: hypothetical protein ACTSRA_13565, partial [Promethearchaeota archaeon]